MNRTSTLCKMASLALTMLLCALPLMAQKNTRRPVGDRAAHRKAEPVKIMKVNGQEKYAYGVVGFDYTQYYLQNTFTRFPFTDGATFTKVTDLVDSEHDVTAGAYADGYYFNVIFPRGFQCGLQIFGVMVLSVGNKNNRFTAWIRRKHFSRKINRRSKFRTRHGQHIDV